ncbi:hypothetical protein SNOG_10841 [Parastagonospora nodorum SN15]|uniref:Uncharacterized protein n=1 Tax=Phaeosphaeria nodorum (strain SN15 / ATCC MYA-4574 / FGSC 10173) TaxID=321614 RepID=Q0UBM3_PHANO|nr:hypothetical protein SNOG_10841 [Parastagonospora nodorum SN15]EAT82235.1 hypothetical protein SNOG_10841 [Parastagonospora nodorum SN15]
MNNHVNMRIQLADTRISSIPPPVDEENTWSCRSWPSMQYQEGVPARKHVPEDEGMRTMSRDSSFTPISWVYLGSSATSCPTENSVEILVYSGLLYRRPELVTALHYHMLESYQIREAAKYVQLMRGK